MTNNNALIRFVTLDGKALHVYRANDSKTGLLPEAILSSSENVEQSISQACYKSLGAMPYGQLKKTPDGIFTQIVRHQFTPKLNAEKYTDFKWIKQEKKEGIAFDRSSVRAIDQDGRMRVEISHISKAMVCPYLGSEIPGCDELGLDQSKVYHLFRDPEELKKSVPTWNGVPLLNEHIPVSASDHQPQAVVGATGTDAAFNEPYLDNSLVIWVEKSINDIQSGKQQEISCSYYYTPDMTPGEFNGVSYDGVMRDIRANHVALVVEGRAGPDVLVNDSLFFNGDKHMGNSLSKKAFLAKGALMAILKPKMLAADSQLDLNVLLADVEKKNWLNKKPGIIADIKSKLAKDADISDVIDLLDKLDSEECDMDNDDMDAMDAMDEMDPKFEDLMSLLRGKISDEDLEKVKSMLSDKKAEDEPLKVAEEADPEPKDGMNKELIKTVSDDKEDDDKKEKEKDMMSKSAMDKAIELACEATRRKTIEQLRHVSEAEELVKPYVGKLTAMDSAPDVFKAALDALKVDVTGVHPSAYKAILIAQPLPSQSKKSSVAQDAAYTSDIYEAFPDLLSK